MTDVSDDNGTPSDRRIFLKTATAAGIAGAAGVASTVAQAQDNRAGAAKNPPAPPGLKETPDLRYPVCYQTPMTEGVRVLMNYFAALSQRDAKGMADAMHFPFGSYEGIDYAIVKSSDDFMSHAPPSMNLTENPERFTDHDGYLKPGAYDMFESLEVLGSDPISATISFCYNRFSAEGKKLLLCQGLYWVTNNDGRWALQKASTIFTPADMIGLQIPDGTTAAKRLRIDHDLQFMQRAALPTTDPPYPTWLADLAAVSPTATTIHSQQYLRYQRYLTPGANMDPFKVVGIKNRLGRGGPANFSAATAPAEPQDTGAPPAHPTDYLEYRDSFKPLGLGPWGFVYGTTPQSRIIHETVDKIHLTTCASRYTAAGELINTDVQVGVVTYQKGYWRATGSVGGWMQHDRGNGRA